MCFKFFNNCFLLSLILNWHFLFIILSPEFVLSSLQNPLTAFSWLKNFLPQGRGRIFDDPPPNFGDLSNQFLENIIPIGQHQQSEASWPYYQTDFKIIWNVPSFQCHKYGLNFSEVSEWGIIQNYGDSFRGDRISLLYDPGFFPALLEATSYSDFVRRNGGVPQEGNLTEHLEIFTDQIVNKLIPDENFAGVAIIDFEHWRPVWSENFGSLLPYKKVSRQIEQSLHPFWGQTEIDREASKRFEKHGWQFFRKTLKLAKSLRPQALWGYYGFPLCFNYTPRNNQPRCTSSVRENNERVKWLFEESTAIYPSLYFKKRGMSEESRALFMKGRMAESVRVTKMTKSQPPIFPYTWMKYYDTKDFVNRIDLINMLAIPKREGAAGAIIWGASNDVNSETKCKVLNNYVENVLGPISKKILLTPRDQIHELIAGIDEKPITTTDSNDILQNIIPKNRQQIIF